MSTYNFPFVWNKEADDGLLGSLFPQGDKRTGNRMSFQGNIVANLSSETSNQDALNSPFGTESFFYVKNGQLINSEIDSQVLMEIIKIQIEKK